MQEKSWRNIMNRQKLKVKHTGGRKSFVRILEEKVCAISDEWYKQQCALLSWALINLSRGSGRRPLIWSLSTKKPTGQHRRANLSMSRLNKITWDCVWLYFRYTSSSLNFSYIAGIIFKLVFSESNGGEIEWKRPRRRRWWSGWRYIQRRARASNQGTHKGWGTWSFLTPLLQWRSTNLLCI